jgi:hypothetical protein
VDRARPAGVDHPTWQKRLLSIPCGRRPGQPVSLRLLLEYPWPTTKPTFRFHHPAPSIPPIRLIPYDACDLRSLGEQTKTPVRRGRARYRLLRILPLLLAASRVGSCHQPQSPERQQHRQSSLSFQKRTCALCLMCGDSSRENCTRTSMSLCWIFWAATFLRYPYWGIQRRRDNVGNRFVIVRSVSLIRLTVVLF